MGTPLMLSIPNNLYERAQWLAQMRQQEVSEVLLAVLEDALPVDTLDTEEDGTIQQEMSAYVALHPQLKEKHLGQHVAIYQGELIDVDADYGQLYERILEQYPDEFVWLTTVKEEAIDTIHMRSPRFLKDES